MNCPDLDLLAALELARKYLRAPNFDTGGRSAVAFAIEAAMHNAAQRVTSELVVGRRFVHRSEYAYREDESGTRIHRMSALAEITRVAKGSAHFKVIRVLSEENAPTKIAPQRVESGGFSLAPDLLAGMLARGTIRFVAEGEVA